MIVGRKPNWYASAAQASRDREAAVGTTEDQHSSYIGTHGSVMLL
jgi:hypothetical protein